MTNAASYKSIVLTGAPDGGAARASHSSLDTRHSSFLSWIGAAGIVAIAVARCCIVFLPQLVFDSDPAADNSPVTALGMGGSLLLDVALIVACVFALLGEWRSSRGGRGLDPVLLLLALVPLPIVIWHGAHDAGDIWRGSTWLASALACATIAHLARDRTLRIVITATLIAVVAPMLLRGAVQMTWEHDATVNVFQQHKAEFLNARGWEPDSPAARIYERRLMHREPLGWFPSTNIFGSVMGAAAVMLVGLAAFAFMAYRAKLLQSGAWFLMAGLAALCVIALKFTTSMGAVLAMVGGGVLLLLLAFGAKREIRNSASSPGQARGYLPRWLGGVMVVMIFGATLGVIARGALLPEGFLHEKSLLFRWHYLEAATGIVSEHAPLGVGPDGFQVAYTLHRVPRNPEEVQSAHSMFTDWVATLGVLGGAWIALVIVLAIRAGRKQAANPTRDVAADRNEEAMLPRRCLRFAAAVGVLAFVPAAFIEWPAFDPTDIFLRGLALLAYIALAYMIASLLSMMSDGAMRGLTAAAVVVLLVHGHIEMTFFQGGSVVWMMAMTGLIGCAVSARSLTVTRLSGAVASLAMLGFAAWLMMTQVFPALSQERRMLEASRLLDPVRENPKSIEIALRQRPLAADQLVEAYELWPTNTQPLNAAVDQLLIASQASTMPSAPRNAGPPLGLLMRAEDLADRAVAAHGKPSSIVLAMNVHASLAAATDDSAQWSRAIALGRRMTEMDPHGVSAWKRLGDVLWSAGAHAEAAKAYEIALVNSDNFALDELKQLSAPKRAEIQSRINAAAAPTSQSDSK